MYSEKAKLCCSKRLVVSILVGIGYMNLIWLRTNLSIAIVEMTTNKIRSSGNQTEITPAEFDWDSKRKGYAFSAFAIGYMFAPLGGVLASRIGGSTLFLYGVAVTSITTLLTPSFSMSSVPEILSRWSAPEERALLSGISVSIYFFGSTISFPITSFIAEFWGWPCIFYVTGSIPLVWSIVWYSLVTVDPVQDRLISDSERAYLMLKVNRKLNDKVNYKIKKMFTSKAVWALWLHRIIYSCGYTFSFMYLPMYLKDIYNLDLTASGAVTFIPHSMSCLFHAFVSYLVDYLRNSGKLTPTQTLKLYVGLGSTSSAIFFLTMSFAKLNLIAYVVFISIVKIFECCTNVVISLGNLDIAPRYASFLWGIESSFFSLGTFLVPIFMGFIITSHKISQWATCFLTFSFMYIINIVFFMIFGSGELQTWSELSDDEEEQSELEYKNTRHI